MEDWLPCEVLIIIINRNIELSISVTGNRHPQLSLSQTGLLNARADVGDPSNLSVLIIVVRADILAEISGTTYNMSGIQNGW